MEKERKTLTIKRGEKRRKGVSFAQHTANKLSPSIWLHQTLDGASTSLYPFLALGDEFMEHGLQRELALSENTVIAFDPYTPPDQRDDGSP
jgi:hypothetical protein